MGGWGVIPRVFTLEVTQVVRRLLRRRRKLEGASGTETKDEGLKVEHPMTVWGVYPGVKTL